MVSAAKGDREVAFPHLNPSVLGRLPAWRAREALRQGDHYHEEGSSGSSTSLFVTSRLWATEVP